MDGDPIGFETWQESAEFWQTQAILLSGAGNTSKLPLTALIVYHGQMNNRTGFERAVSEYLLRLPKIASYRSPHTLALIDRIREQRNWQS